MKLIYMLAFMLLGMSSFAQKQGNIWCFGFAAGLNFNSSPPVPIYGDKIASPEACSSIASSKTGHLLFYSDGVNIWDSANTVMPNGKILGGNISTTQGALIVPKPGSDNLYYLFTANQLVGDYDHNDTSLNVNEVDMNLNGGLGDVTTRDSALFTSTEEKIAATYASDGKNIWVVAHQWNSNAFYAYLVTSSGISTPVISHSGIVHKDEGSGIREESIGYLEFSPDGKRAAVGSSQKLSTLQIFDFDNRTGEFSNPITDTSYRNFSGGVYGVCFSPDNSKLYVTSFESFYNDTSNLFQYNLTAGDSTEILLSRTRIGFYVFWRTYGALQIAPDGKVYIGVDSTVSQLGGGFDSLDVINNPNALGIACNYVRGGQYLGSGTDICGAGLPNMVEQFLYPADTALLGVEKPQDIINQLLVYPNPANDFIHLTLQLQQQQTVQLILYNMLGQQIWTENLGNIKQPNTIIPVTNLPNGIYILKMNLGHESQQREVVVAR